MSDDQQQRSQWRATFTHNTSTHTFFSGLFFGLKPATHHPHLLQVFDCLRHTLCSGLFPGPGRPDPQPSLVDFVVFCLFSSLLLERKEEEDSARHRKSPSFNNETMKLCMHERMLCACVCLCALRHRLRLIASCNRKCFFLHAFSKFNKHTFIRIDSYTKTLAHTGSTCMNTFGYTSSCRSTRQTRRDTQTFPLSFSSSKAYNIAVLSYHFFSKAAVAPEMKCMFLTHTSTYTHIHTP